MSDSVMKAASVCNDSRPKVLVSGVREHFSKRFLPCVFKHNMPVRRVHLIENANNYFFINKKMPILIHAIPNFEFNNSDAEDDGERVVEPLDHSFENLESHVYQVKTEACNVSDVSLQVCRVLRPADVRFSKVIQRDVLGILEYRTFWKKEKDCIDILRSLSPSIFRPKASSCPGDMY